MKFGVLILSAVAFLSMACEDLDFDNDEAGEVQGFWKQNTGTGSNKFLTISSEEVIFYQFSASKNCNTIDAYQVVRIDGKGFYILDQEGLEENKVLAVSRNKDKIQVRDINVTQDELQWFIISELDPATIAPECVDPSNVYGNWELQIESEDPIFLSIEKDSIKVTEFKVDETCYSTSELRILGIDGNVFTLSIDTPDATSETQKVTLTRTVEGLEVERIENGQPIKELYNQSDSDFSSFEPECL